MTPRPLTPFRRGMRAAAIVAAVYCLVVAGFLLHHHWRGRTALVIDSQALFALKAELRAAPTDEALKERIRLLDEQVRREFFHRQELSRKGSRLLGGGVVALLLCIGLAGGLARPPMGPTAPLGKEATARATRTRLAIAGVGVTLFGAALGYLSRPVPQFPDALPEGTPLLATAAPALPSLPPGQSWPRFRGPDGTGVAPAGSAPRQWNLETGDGLHWRVAVPLPGQSSPIVWGERVFLTGGDAERCVVYCFAAESGELLWETPVKTGRARPLEQVYPDTGYAAPTPCTDGQRVYAMFANGDLAALTLDGRLVWSSNPGTPDNQYGHAASPILWRDRLLVQLDQGHEGEGKSRLFSFVAATGEIDWEIEREAPATWATPLVVPAGGGEQLIANGSPWVTAYDLTSGDELWRAKLLQGEVVASPIFAGGEVLVATAGAWAAAIRPNGSGDVTDSHVRWKGELGLPDIVSPLSDGTRLYLVSTGQVTCYALASGLVLWEHDYGQMIWASPTLADGVVYLPDQHGVVHLFAAGDTFQAIADLPLGAACNASPAIAHDRLFVRTATHLLCLGGP